MIIIEYIVICMKLIEKNFKKGNKNLSFFIYIVISFIVYWVDWVYMYKLCNEIISLFVNNFINGLNK